VRILRASMLKVKMLKKRTSKEAYHEGVELIDSKHFIEFNH